MTSQIGSFAEGAQGLLAYSTSKTALNRGMVNLASILAEEDISVHLINPGWVKTDMGGSLAPVTMSESVDGMMKVLESQTLENSGRFIQFDGEILPW